MRNAAHQVQKRFPDGALTGEDRRAGDQADFYHEEMARRMGLRWPQDLGALGSVYNDGTADTQRVFPRFRFDQLMSLAWKVFIPMALVNLVAVMIVMEFLGRDYLWMLLPVSIAILVGAGLITTAPVNRKG